MGTTLTSIDSLTDCHGLTFHWSWLTRPRVCPTLRLHDLHVLNSASPSASGPPACPPAGTRPRAGQSSAMTARSSSQRLKPLPSGRSNRQASRCPLSFNRSEASQRVPSATTWWPSARIMGRCQSSITGDRCLVFRLKNFGADGNRLLSDMPDCRVFFFPPFLFCVAVVRFLDAGFGRDDL